MGRKPGSRNKNAGEDACGTGGKRPIESYEHTDKERVNNPPVGLVTPETDPDVGQKKKTYAYDPHLDPQLEWAGKTEHTSFEISTVSLHVHERIDPRTIIEAVRKGSAGVSPANKSAGGDACATPLQLSLFEMPVENPPLREAIEFYKHAHGWSNRMVAGDSLLVMNSLLEKEGMAGKVQMVYLDPPYGIKYGSNFQPFVNKRDVKDGKDEDLTAEPEQIRAFRDTWELGIHSYLTYLRDRLLLARELLTESGSVFVQISDENVHHVRELMDEVFGANNYCGLVFFLKTSGKGSAKIDPVGDYLVWYGKDAESTKIRPLFKSRNSQTIDEQYNMIQLEDGAIRRLTAAEIRGDVILAKGRRFMPSSMYSDSGGQTTSYSYQFQGKSYRPLPGYYWRTNREGMDKLVASNRVVAVGNYLRYVMFSDDYPVVRINNMWDDVRSGGFGEAKVYVVQTNTDVAARCLLMTTDPGDLVFDPTCGSGTTAYVAEQWGRRWITCDTSRVALTLARQRLMTAVFDYYELAHPQEGVGSGFVYKTVPHVTLKSIANNEPPGTETLYDQPLVDRKKHRVSGPFTVEAVPAPAVKSMDEIVAQASSPASSTRENARDAGGDACAAPGDAGGDACATPGDAGETPALLSGWHWRGYLPHLKAESGTYFVTFRLADTLPKEVLESYRFEREDIVKRAEATGRELSPDEEKRLAELYSERIESYLDAGHGECRLKRPEIGRMVAEALRHFDGERYFLHAWVVMPNHVHAVVTPLQGHSLSDILQNWKSFTAHEAKKVAQASSPALNKKTNKAGEDARATFWQRESYDHLVRDEADFARVCAYTVQNPVKAGLCEKPEDWPFIAVAQASPPALNDARKARNAGGDACATVADVSIARSGETLRQGEWRDELLRTGIRGKAGQHIRFARLEPLPGCRYLHADGETRPSDEGRDSVRETGPAYAPQRIVVSFGPEHAPLEQRQVEHAWEEARTLVPQPKLLVFAAFQFDPEAAKDIDELKPELAGMQFLKVQMNADLLTDDLKKKRASNESFWLIGQPDVELRKVAQTSSPALAKKKSAGEDACATLYQVEVKGFDYYNTKTGGIESGGAHQIAVWMLDTDYDGRSLYPRQVFFPQAGESEGWARLAKNLKAEIDEELIESYRGTVSLPFAAGEHNRIAVKIVDDRGIESLKVMEME